MIDEIKGRYFKFVLEYNIKRSKAKQERKLKKRTKKYIRDLKKKILVQSSIGDREVCESYDNKEVCMSVKDNIEKLGIKVEYNHDQYSIWEHKLHIKW